MSNPDPRMDDLVETLRRLEESLRSVREELGRQGERTGRNAEAVERVRTALSALQEAMPSTELQELRLRALLGGYATNADVSALRDVTSRLRGDVDKLMTVVKPDERTGIIQQQQADHMTLWRWVFGVGGVVAFLSLLALVAKLWSVLLMGAP